MLQKRIKQYMDDIIDVAFADESVFDRNGYKNYSLHILVKENASSSGMYHYKGHKIEVYNPSLGARHLAKCCLHELSHHIDYIKNGTSGHQRPFYEIYAKLVYASMDMGILTAKDFDDHWSSDQNKVRVIVDAYEPHPVDYKMPEITMLRVRNGFSVKDQLKEHGYHWNKVEQVWEKELSQDNSDEEAFLIEIGVDKMPDKNVVLPRPCYFIESPGMHINAVVYIEASGKTYECKDILKKYGFYFDRDKKIWVCKVEANKKDIVLFTLRTDDDLKTCYFGILKRKK